MDDKTSRRIESTIIRKETSPVKLVEVAEIEVLDEVVEELNEPDPTPELKVEEVLAPVVIKASEPQEIVEEPTIEPLKDPPTVEEEVSKNEISIPSVEQPLTESQEIVVETIPEVEPVIEAVKTTVVSVEKKRIPIEQKVAAHKSVTLRRRTSHPLVAGKTENKKASTPLMSLLKKLTEICPRKSGFHIGAQKAMVVLFIGSALYFVALILSAFGSFDKLEGLSIGAVSSVLIIFGMIMICPSLKRKVSGEVFICPKCHETVEKSEKNCPSCGARFFPED